MNKSILHDGLGHFNQPLLACLVISWTINYLLLLASNNFMKYVSMYYNMNTMCFFIM